MGTWYMSRIEIEENSPSRKDGIDLKKETSLRKSYCTFLKDLGIRLKLPQGTIATAIIFCHRFFLRQSHAKNDQMTIATVCMFLAGKVKETPCHLKDVVLVSYKMIHKKDPAAVQRIQQKEVYEQQKELILLGERVLLATLDFDLNVQLPYEPLAEGIIKFNVAKNYALVRAAWCFVDDGLSTSLCLQFKPNHIAASALFLAAKFLKVNLPSDGEKDWWQEYDLTPCQLDEVTYQMLELYEQKRIPPSQASEAEGVTRCGTRAATEAPATDEEQASKQISFHPALQYSCSKNNAVSLRGTENQSNSGSTELGCDITCDNKREMGIISKSGTGRIVAGDQDSMVRRNLKNKEGSVGKEAVQMIDEVKLKAAFAKRRKERGAITIKKYVMDDDDFIDRELVDGVELALENEKNKQEIGKNWSKPDDVDHGKVCEETRDGRQMSMKGQLQIDMNEYIAEEGEVIDDDDASSLLNSRKRKMGSPPAWQPEMKKRLRFQLSDCI